MREIYRRRIQAALFLVVAGVSSLAAQSPAFDDAVSVSNWAAPPYWTPPAERPRGVESKHAMSLGNPSLAFHAVTPCRIADTRGPTGPYGGPPLVAGVVRSFTVTGLCGIPAGVAAVSFNFAVTNLAANGNLIVYPAGGSAPSVSSLNWTPVEIAISNAAVIALGSDAISVVVNGPGGSTVDLIFDVNGYYAADPVVTSLNGISGAVTLAPSGDVTVTPAAPNLTIGTNATSASTPNTIVRRDASGNFNGNASGFTGSLAGDVTGSQAATVVASVGGSTAAGVHSAELLANAATSSDVPSTIVRRDGAGDVVLHGILAKAGYTQPGTGGQALKTIHGVFLGNASFVSGGGFAVVRNATGNYTVTFSTPFSEFPSFTVSPVSAGGVYIYLINLFGDHVTFQVVSPTGVALDVTALTFIATGAV